MVPPWIWMILVFCGIAVGIVVGRILEWGDHREYCGCDQCNAWRKDMADKAVKKEGKTE